MQNSINLKSLTRAQARQAVVYSGPGAIAALPEALAGLGCKRPFLVADPGLTKAGLTDKVKNVLINGQEVDFAGYYDRITEEAGITSVIECFEEYKRVNADGFVAVGGGSVLDATKFIRWMIGYGIKTREEAIEYFAGRHIVLMPWPEGKPLTTPFVSIPTTAGTGAEISDTAVIHDDQVVPSLHMVLRGPAISPNIALLDAYMTFTLPQHLTAGTGFDAFCHAMEAFFSPKHNPYADANSLQAIKMIAQYLPVAVREPENVQARQMMLDANIIGILAFGLALADIPIHKMTLAFGAMHQRHHGISNATGMTAVMEIMPEFYLPRIREFAEGVGLHDLPENDREVLKVVVKWLAQLREDCLLPEKFHNFYLTEAQVEEMVPAVRREGFTLDEERVKTIVRRMVEVRG